MQSVPTTEQGESADAVRQEALEIAVIALSPIVPHITHTLWHALGHPAR
jgi:leucyl-tRNA synthetase